MCRSRVGSRQIGVAGLNRPGFWPFCVKLALSQGNLMAAPTDERLQDRSDLAWSIAVGGIGVVLFTALLAFTWYYAAAILLLFTGMLLGVGLNAMTNRLGRIIHMP